MVGFLPPAPQPEIMRAGALGAWIPRARRAAADEPWTPPLPYPAGEHGRDASLAR